MFVQRGGGAEVFFKTLNFKHKKRKEEAGRESEDYGELACSERPGQI